LRWPTDRALVSTQLEYQPRTVGIADIDTLTRLNIDRRHPATVDENSIQAAVVDCHPSALVESQHQVGAGDQGVRDPYIGAEITPDDHIMACCEGARRSVVPNGQHRWGWVAHRDQL
jgi:hypothetical protein